MPILLRISNSACSLILEMSWSNTSTLPDSGLNQSHRRLQQHGLAAAGRSQNHPRFAFVRLKRNVVQRQLAVEGDGDVFERRTDYPAVT